MMGPTVDNPRIELQHLKAGDELDDDGLPTMVPATKEDAEMTKFIITVHHPVDDHEFGLALMVTEVKESLDGYYLKSAKQALSLYLSEHPEGERS